MPSMTITVTTDDWNRIKSALTTLHGPPDPMTDADRVKAILKDIVQGWMTQAQQVTAAVAMDGVSVTVQ